MHPPSQTRSSCRSTGTVPLALILQIQAIERLISALILSTYWDTATFFPWFSQDMSRTQVVIAKSLDIHPSTKFVRAN